MKHFSSYWERSVLLRPLDFAIIGAGLVGKQIAIKLKAKFPLSRIAIIDRSPISYGASTRNAGFSCFGSVTEIVDDLSHTDASQVAQLAQKRFQGIQQLVESFGADNIGYRNTGSFEIFKNESDFNQAFEHLNSVNQLLEEQANIKNAFSIQSTSNMKMNCHHQCIFNPYEGMLNSGMLNETINDIAHRSGVLPFYGLNIVEFEKDANGYRLLSEDGMELQCKQLIIANNAFASQLMPELDVVPARGQVIITEPIANLPFDGIFHSDKGYIYFRNIDNRVLIGGGRNAFKEQETTYDFEGSEALKTYLENYLKEVVLPNHDFKTDMHWSGIMAMGKQKLPIVKRYDENLVLCVRMSGMGVALAPVLSSDVLAFFD
ncbi:MAG TPA: FAD-dependent oxidoreductase [Bacteroidia bacterium]